MELSVMLLCGALIFVLSVVFFRAAGIANHRRGSAGPEPDEYVSSRAAESLSNMIQIRTTGGTASSGDEFRELGDYLRARFPHTFEALRWEEADGNLLLRWKGGDDDADPILFCANTDVVSAEGAWEYGPFSGEIAENMVWGRGAIESKGILCALLEAVEELTAAGFIPKRDIYISIVNDAESGRTGSAEISELFRKRGLRFAAAFSKGVCISKDMLPIGIPQAIIGVAEKGHMKVRLSAEDRGGRSDQPPRYTAVGRLCEAVCRIEYRPRPVRKSVIMHEMISGIAPYLPFGKRILAANLWLFEGRFYESMRSYPAFYSMLRTTFAVTEIKSGSAENRMPSAASATVHVRTIHGDSCSDICRFLVNLVGSVGVRVDVDLAEEASPVSPYKGKDYSRLKKVLAESFGDIVAVPAIIGGGANSNAYAPYTDAFYRITPFVLTEAEKSTIHSTNERIGKYALGRAVGFYKKLIESEAG
jgi:carboxypeptidase PM20D1